MVKIIHEDSGNKLKLFRILTFNKIFARLYMNIDLVLPDIGKLYKYWSGLSEYCHKQLKPEETWKSEKWIIKGYEFLNKVEDYLWKIFANKFLAWLKVKSMPEELKNERLLFLDEKINESELKRRLEIIEPMILFRERLKI